MRPSRLGGLLGLPTLALATAALPLLAPMPAQAATSPAVALGQAACLHPAAARHDRPTPRWRQYDDHPEVDSSDLNALPLEETTRKFIAQEVEPVLPSTVTIPVYVHVIKGKHRGERVPAGPRKVRRLMRIINDGYSGGQSTENASTRFRFDLRKIDYKRRDGWFHAFSNGPRDTRMKRALHRGGKNTLNLYINGGGPRDYPILGWARFPWQRAKAPKLDGVNVNVAALPGGRATGYNSGDTAIHEIGHWLGLFHTFQRGCGAQGDMVLDTPAEAEPSYYCETTRDTCPAPGLDPVHNFMDYSLDGCMNQFTLGQVRRMDASYEKWRQ